jgi:hypothetical protein
VVFAWSEIRAVRRVVKQLLVEMLQHYSSASICMWTLLVMEEHYTGFQHSTPFILDGPMQSALPPQYTSDIIVVPYCMTSIISTPSLPQKIVVISFLADNICLNFVGLFSECMCIHCFGYSLVQHSQMKPRFCHLLLV